MFISRVPPIWYCFQSVMRLNTLLCLLVNVTFSCYCEGSFIQNIVYILHICRMLIEKAACLLYCFSHCQSRSNICLKCWSAHLLCHYEKCHLSIYALGDSFRKQYYSSTNPHRVWLLQVFIQTMETLTLFDFRNFCKQYVNMHCMNLYKSKSIGVEFGCTVMSI